MECKTIVDVSCSRQHQYSQICAKSGAPCHICQNEDRKREEKRQRDMKLEGDREANQRAYANRLKEIQDEIAFERRRQKEASENAERERVLKQHENDLQTLRDRPLAQPNHPQQADVKENAPKPNAMNDKESRGSVNEQREDDRNHPHGPDPSASAAKDDWKHQKTFEGAENSSLDDLMGMIGLEEVKDKFLAIKASVDTAIRQNVDMKDQRFGAKLLGNPGTGE